MDLISCAFKIITSSHIIISRLTVYMYLVRCKPQEPIVLSNLHYLYCCSLQVIRQSSVWLMYLVIKKTLLLDDTTIII